MTMSLEQADRIVRRLWEADVKVWEAHWVPIFRRFARDLVSDSGASPGKLVLDIGTGTGVAAFEAARRISPEGFVLGIDRLKPMVMLAKAKAARDKVSNVRFLQMNSRRLLFPDKLFDAVMSNCGISSVGFDQTTAEVFRVLRDGEVFVFNDWRLQDVPLHRMFGEILREHRTTNPSSTLKAQRKAQAMLGLPHEAQMKQLRKIGFKVETKSRNYKITLPSLETYLDVRLKRATLKQELKELPLARRKEMLQAFREKLKPFVRGRRFLFNWRVTFVRAKKK